MAQRHTGGPGRAVALQVACSPPPPAVRLGPGAVARALVWDLREDSIAAYLESNSYNNRMVNLDYCILRDPEYDVPARLASLHAPVFGIDLHWLPHANGALGIAELVKSIHPRSKVLLGGFRPAASTSSSWITRPSASSCAATRPKNPAGSSCRPCGNGHHWTRWRTSRVGDRRHGRSQPADVRPVRPRLNRRPGV